MTEAEAIGIDGSLTGTRAVVFGGAGFLGSHLARALAVAGAATTVYDLRPPAGGTFVGTFVEGDVRDPEAVRHVLDGADRVFAFAGHSGATGSMADPLRDLAISCEAQLVLLDAVRERCPGATVVFPGSRLEYGRPVWLPVDERHPLVGDAPYAIHKTACAGYYRAYALVHGMRTIVLRFSNPYGPHPIPGQFKGFGILNHFVDLAWRGLPIQLFGEGSQLRDFVFVDDAIQAVIAASGHPECAGMVMNIGAGEGVSLADAAREVVRVAGSGSIEHIAWPDDYCAVETGDFYFDITRARELLGWRPRTSLRRGLEITLDACASMI